MYDRNNPAPVSAAFRARYPDHDGKAGALGWPLVPSVLYPGETTLACPECGDRSVLLTSLAPPRGTGPMGRARMGDSGWRDVNECAACGWRSTGAEPLAPRPTRIYVGHAERSARGTTTHYAIQVPLEHAAAWLASGKVRFPDAYLSDTWSDNSTVMAWYDGTPDARVVLNPDGTPTK